MVLNEATNVKPVARNLQTWHHFMPTLKILINMTREFFNEEGMLLLVTIKYYHYYFIIIIIIIITLFIIILLLLILREF